MPDPADRRIQASHLRETGDRRLPAAQLREAGDRRLPAPQLRETADIWFDSATDPLICWDASGRRYWLVDGGPSDERLVLLVVDSVELPADPPVIAAALREGLAACDFPPTESGVSPDRAAATLRAAGISLGEH